MPNAASVALFCNDDVLLVRRARAPYQGYWTLPGGCRKKGETIEACAKREMLEELGIKIGPLLPVTQTPAGSTFLLQIFTAYWDGLPILPNTEITDWRWVSPSDVATLHITPGLADVLALAANVLSKM